MPFKLLLAKPIHKKLIPKIKLECVELKKMGIVPNLKVILVGDNPASIIYTNNKKKFCEKIGARCEIIKLPVDTTEKNLRTITHDLSQNKDINGILIQLPLPPHLSHLDVGNLITPEKDVDGLNDVNMAKLLKNDNSGIIPCTARGILTLLDYYQIPIHGANVCIVGRSMIVGKPLALTLTNRNATVTLCHANTKNLHRFTNSSDIVICAIGKPKFFNTHFFDKTKDQTIIDVGINHDQNKNLCGDTDYDNILKDCYAITPVPGGVGPMTILSLAQNLLSATQIQHKIK